MGAINGILMGIFAVVHVYTQISVRCAPLFHNFRLFSKNSVDSDQLIRILMRRVFE